MVDAYIQTIQSGRKRHLLERAREMGIHITVLSQEFRILELFYRGRTRVLSDENHHLGTKPGTIFSRNKEMTKILLKRRGISVAPGFVAANPEEALKTMPKLRIHFPIVVKPIDGMKGEGVTVNVQSRTALRRAFAHARRYWMRVSSATHACMIEELQPGKDFRVLVLDSRAIACAQRIPASIFGNGRSTIEQIIRAYNHARPTSYHLILDSDVLDILRKNNLTSLSVLPKGSRIQVRQNANVSSGGRAVDYSEKISPRFKKIAVACATALGLRFTGIDILVDDITSNDPRQPYCVIEVNGAPEYDIHERPVVEGKGVDVTTLIVKALMRS